MGTAQFDTRILIKEINKIVAAPYPVLFKTLAHILERVDDGHIYLWTVAKGCQIAALVSRITESLERDEAALLVLLELIRNRVIRDAVIKQDPRLLQILFTFAGKENVAEACLALCQYPFPESFAPPAAYFDFVDSVLGNFYEKPVSGWIQDVHSILTSLSYTTLATINQDTIQKCVSLWNEASRAPDSPTFIRFLSVAAVIQRMYLDERTSFSCGSTSSPDSDPLLLWAAKCSGLFVDPKAHKTLKSVLLRTLQMVSDTSTASRTDTVRCLEMIRGVIVSIPEKVRCAAIQAQETAQVVTKVVQKATQEHVDVEKRLCVSGILLGLDPDCWLWDIALLRSAYNQFVHFQLQLPEPTRRNVPSAIGLLEFQQGHQQLFQFLEQKVLFENSPIQEIMQYLVSWSRPGIYGTIETIGYLQAATLFITSLRRLAIDTERDDQALSGIIETNIPEWWNWNLSSPIENTSCCNLEICPRVKESIQRRLASGISSQIIRCASLSKMQLGQTKYHLLQDIAHQNMYAGQESECCWVRPLNHYNGKQNVATWLSSQTHFGAQEQLQEALGSVNEQTLKFVKSYIDTTCQDLQHRCHDVEAPLRAEQEKSNNLQKELNEARSCIEVMLADHRASKILWQNDLDIEQKEVDSLRENRASIEQALATTAIRLEEEVQIRILAEQHNILLTGQYDTLRKEAEEERLVLGKLKDECECVTMQNQVLARQLQDAQGKEQQLMQVLQGGKVDA